MEDIKIISILKDSYYSKYQNLLTEVYDLLDSINSEEDLDIQYNLIMELDSKVNELKSLVEEYNINQL